MSSANASRTAASTVRAKDGQADKAPQPEVSVHNCTRLGRTANPPRFSIANLLRFGRWR